MKNKRYTLEEMKEFLKNSSPCDSMTSEYDESSNYWYDEVRHSEIDDKYYVVSFLNGRICPVRPKKKDEDDWYELPEVKPVKKIIEITEWEFSGVEQSGSSSGS